MLFGNGISHLDLASHTLTKVGQNQISLINTTVTDGNIVINNGTLGLQGGTKVLNNASGTTITVNDGGTLDVGASGSPSFSVTRQIVMNGGNLTNNGGGTTYIGSNISVDASTENSISNSEQALHPGQYPWFWEHYQIGRWTSPVSDRQ